MDGKRIQDYWSNEVDALVKLYNQFELLVPNEKTDGAAHRGEDGRYVEELIRQYLMKYLPTSVEVLTGFILRPAVKTGLHGKERANEKDTCSSQLDIIVYNSKNYPIFQRFGNSVIVPPEGVIAIISVKKHLYEQDITKECKALLRASELCFTKDTKGKFIRGPFLSIIAVKSKIERVKTSICDLVFKKIKETYHHETKPYFDQLIGYIGVLEEWSIFKRRPKKKALKYGEYIYFEHDVTEAHLSLQFILTGILSVLYDSSRTTINRPGFTAFPSKRKSDKFLGKVEVTDIRK